MQVPIETPLLKLTNLQMDAQSFSDGYLLDKSTVTPMRLPMVQAGICFSLAILVASIIPLYSFVENDYLLPILGIVFFAVLGFVLLFYGPYRKKREGKRIFNSNAFLALPFEAYFYKEYYVIKNDNEVIKEYWTNIDRCLETKKSFILCGGNQRLHVMIAKNQLSTEQIEEFSKLLTHRLAYKHKKQTK